MSDPKPSRPFPFELFDLGGLRQDRQIRSEKVNDRINIGFPDIVSHKGPVEIFAASHLKRAPEFNFLQIFSFTGEPLAISAPH